MVCTEEAGTQLVLPPPDPRVGKIVLDRYRITMRVGSGASGMVYLGVQRDCGRDVAIKILQIPPDVDSRLFLRRFVQEARLLCRVQHPNIVTLFDFGCAEEGELCTVMEHIEGPSLENWLGLQGALSPDASLDLAIQLARALNVVHEAGVVHRDLKPSNIMLYLDDEEEPILKLLDFGLAKDLDGERMTKPGAALGTPGYMAPEQVLGDHVDHRADFYAFGVILYEMLTGQRLYKGKNPVQVLLQQAKNVRVKLPAPLSQRLCAPVLQRVLDRTSGGFAEQRYEHCQALLDDLMEVRRLLRASDRAQA